jgi:hypothetical protein
VGVLRQAGLRILETQAGDPKVQGFFQAFLDGASSGETEPALNSLFAGDPKQDLIWGILGEILELQNPNDIATAKSIGFELLSGLDSLGKARTGSRNELLDPVLRALQPILSRDGAFLARHTDLVGDLLTWGELADFLRAINSDRGPARPALLDLMIDALSDSRRGTDLLAILKALDSNPRAHRAWDELRANWKSLDQLPEYRTLGLTEIGRQGLDFLEARASDGTALPADQAALSRKILTTVATDLERNDMELVDQLLALAQRRPDEFYRLVESVSQLIENGEVPHLLDLMQKNLQAVGH